MRNVLNSGERRERDLREELKMQSNTTDGFPATKTEGGDQRMQTSRGGRNGPLSLS